MSRPSRRTVIRGSLCLGAAGTVARPFIAKAAATTASVWWTQGFVREEDAAFQAMVADYEIIEAEDGEQALAAITKQRPDLILMDVQMPIMDGYTATSRIKSDPALLHKS